MTVGRCLPPQYKQIAFGSASFRQGQVVLMESTDILCLGSDAALHFICLPVCGEVEQVNYMNKFASVFSFVKWKHPADISGTRRDSQEGA